jgi:hypothetical protein
MRPQRHAGTWPGLPTRLVHRGGGRRRRRSWRPIRPRGGLSAMQLELRRPARSPTSRTLCGRCPAAPSPPLCSTVCGSCHNHATCCRDRAWGRPGWALPRQSTGGAGQCRFAAEVDGRYRGGMQRLARAVRSRRPFVARPVTSPPPRANAALFGIRTPWIVTCSQCRALVRKPTCEHPSRCNSSRRMRAA